MQVMRTWLVLLQPWGGQYLYPYYIAAYQTDRETAKLGGTRAREMLNAKQPEEFIGLEAESWTHFRSGNDRYVVHSRAKGTHTRMRNSKTQQRVVLPELTSGFFGRSGLLDDLRYFSMNELQNLLDENVGDDFGSTISAMRNGGA
ncbi:unnamed protein product, partial [Amoebophrya sp. A25]|eukprot:GSA25T00002810001.1